MMPATSENEKVRFHTINRETENRVISRYVDIDTGKAVEDDDEVKGYQAMPSAMSSSKTRSSKRSRWTARRRSISTSSFRATPFNGSCRHPHYLTPNDQVGEEAFSVIRDAMAAKKMVGISVL